MQIKDVLKHGTIVGANDNFVFTWIKGESVSLFTISDEGYALKYTADEPDLLDVNSAINYARYHLTSLYV